MYIVNLCKFNKLKIEKLDIDPKLAWKNTNIDIKITKATGDKQSLGKTLFNFGMVRRAYKDDF